MLGIDKAHDHLNVDSSSLTHHSLMLQPHASPTYIDAEPFYAPSGNEIDVFEAA